MKKVLLLAVLTLSFISCDTDDENETVTPTVFDIEGKWLWSPSTDVSDANTMYEYRDGTRYTYYCDTAECDSIYWNSLDTSDAIPGTETYTFENDTLTLDGMDIAITFECDGGKVNFGNYYLWRVGSDCE
jgi:hypothetical protein